MYVFKQEQSCLLLSSLLLARAGDLVYLHGEVGTAREATTREATTGPTPLAACFQALLSILIIDLSLLWV